MTTETLKEIEFILFEGINYAQALSVRRKSNEYIETSKEMMKLLLRGVHLVQDYKKQGKSIEELTDSVLYNILK